MKTMYRIIEGYYSLYHNSGTVSFVKLSIGDARTLFRLATDLDFNNIVLERNGKNDHIVGDMTFIIDNLSKYRTYILGWN